jgi:hypothetical protein
MPECYLGRGQLLARVIGGPLTGFTKLVGESEITVSFAEQATDIVDARYGRFETVDRFVSSIQATLEAQVFDFSTYGLPLLLKMSDIAVPAASNRVYIFPNPVQVQAVYPLDRANLSGSFLIQDSLSATLTSSTHFTVDKSLGLVEFLNITGFVQPFTAVYNNDLYRNQGIVQKNNIYLELLFIGTNKVTGKAVSARFYKAQLEVAAALKLVGKEFSSAPLKCTLLADFSHNVDDVLSHYGRFVKL